MFFSRTRGNYKNLSLMEIRQFSPDAKLVDNRYIFFKNYFDFNRLSLSNFIVKILSFGENLEDLKNNLLNYFKDKYFEDYRISGCYDLCSKFGDVIKGKVNLKKPKIEFFVDIINNKIFFGILVWKRNNKIFEKHFMRSYYRSDNLKPTCARFLVNLSLVKKGETLIDPFCGTGSILIEGAYLGAKCIGIEIDQRIYEGCLDNLFVLGYDNNCEVYNADALTFNYGGYDVLVTDLPYGRSSSLKKRNREDFINALPHIFKHVKKRKVVMYNQDISDIWDLIEMEKYKVHGGLTRYIHVFR